MDWDQDGRLDVWVKNRSGPQLRFLKNERENSNNFVSLKLEGSRTNRDAIGAVVELTAAGQRRVQQVSAGQGYLAQSSSTLHFGLGEAVSIERLVVRWPGGERESIDPVAVNGHYRVIEGTGRAVRLKIVPITLPEPRPAKEGGVRPTPLLLKTPLPLPPGLLHELGTVPGRVNLVNLWAHWCEPCASEVEEWLGRSAMLEARSIRWSSLSLDRPEDREAATEWFRRRHELAGSSASPTPSFIDPGTLDTLAVLLEHVTGKSGELPIPANLMIDERGNLQMLYFGFVSPDGFLSDASRFLDPAVPASRRSLYPGRWYYRSGRNYDELARHLNEAGRAGDAEFYRERARGD